MKTLIFLLLGYFFFFSPTGGVFEQGKQAYQSGSFEASKNIFLQLPQSPESFHNVANSMYHLGDLSGSLAYYEDSLNLGENELTRNNYEYVKSLLKNQNTETQEENQQSEEEQRGQDTSSESQTGIGSQQEDPSDDTSSQDTSANGDTSQDASLGDILPQPRDEQYKLGNGKQVDELSDSEKQQLENYIQKLEKEEQQERGSFGKLGDQNSGDLGDSLFDQFFGGSIFSNDFGSSEKDW